MALAPSKVRGFKADLVIVDEIRSMIDSVIEKITKASELNFKENDTPIDFKGSVVTVKNGASYRRRTLPPGQVTLVSAYDGKRKGVILQCDHISGTGEVTPIEIPLKEAPAVLDELCLCRALESAWFSEAVPAPSAMPTLKKHPNFGVF